MLDNLLQPQLSPAFLERKHTFNQIYSSKFERCRKQTARSHTYRNRFKQLYHLAVGQKVLYKIRKQDLSRSEKLQLRRLGPFTIIKRITNTTFQIQDDKDPAFTQTVHRNQLFHYYSKEESLPAMIEEHVPPDHQNDNFHERFMEQRARGLNNPSTTDKHDPSPFPIEPLQYTWSKDRRKRLCTHSTDSEINPPLAPF